MLIGAQLSQIASGYYQQKDATKFRHCNVLIARGVVGSSSAKYAMHCIMVNPGFYLQDDVVAVSVNGARAGRLPVDIYELLAATAAGVTIITDKASDRLRSFNVGEREVAAHLIEAGYAEVDGNGIWTFKEVE